MEGGDAREKKNGNREVPVFSFSCRRRRCHEKERRHGALRFSKRHWRRQYSVFQSIAPVVVGFGASPVSGVRCPADAVRPAPTGQLAVVRQEKANKYNKILGIVELLYYIANVSFRIAVPMLLTLNLTYYEKVAVKERRRRNIGESLHAKRQGRYQRER